jgi:hypothetical protein
MHAIETILIPSGPMATLPPRFFPLQDDLPSGCFWAAGAVVMHDFGV